SSVAVAHLASISGLNGSVCFKALAKEAPKQTEPFKPLMEAKWATATLDVTDKVVATAKMHFPQEKQATAALKTGKTFVGLAKKMVAGLEADLKRAKAGAELVKLMGDVAGLLKEDVIKQKGRELTAQAELKIDQSK